MDDFLYINLRYGNDTRLMNYLNNLITEHDWLLEAMQYIEDGSPIDFREMLDGSFYCGYCRKPTYECTGECNE